MNANKSKQELKYSSRQLATVIDLNKCMGCQSCTVACNNLWTQRAGTEHMRWANVGTYPGRGYPRDWQIKGGGYDAKGNTKPGKLTNLVDACPYGMVYFNPVTKKSEKCIECFPRVDQEIAPACNRQCVGRTRAYGFLDDKRSQVYKLVKEWKVALPLHSEYGTDGHFDQSSLGRSIFGVCQ